MPTNGFPSLAQGNIYELKDTQKVARTPSLVQGNIYELKDTQKVARTPKSHSVSVSLLKVPPLN